MWEARGGLETVGDGRPPVLPRKGLERIPERIGVDRRGQRRSEVTSPLWRESRAGVLLPFWAGSVRGSKIYLPAQPSVA